MSKKIIEFDNYEKLLKETSKHTRFRIKTHSIHYIHKVKDPETKKDTGVPAVKQGWVLHIYNRDKTKEKNGLSPIKSKISKIFN